MVEPFLRLIVASPNTFPNNPPCVLHLGNWPAMGDMMLAFSSNVWIDANASPRVVPYIE